MRFLLIKNGVMLQDPEDIIETAPYTQELPAFLPLDRITPEDSLSAELIPDWLFQRELPRNRLDA